MGLDLSEFPADDQARARRFWATLLDLSLDERKQGEGQSLPTRGAGAFTGETPLRLSASPFRG